jgi:S1-C subfamily serine protease
MVIHNPDGRGVFVTHVEPDGEAANQGILLGWGLVAVNGKAVPNDVSDVK